MLEEHCWTVMENSFYLVNFASLMLLLIFYKTRPLELRCLLTTILLFGLCWWRHNWPRIPELRIFILVISIISPPNSAVSPCLPVENIEPYFNSDVPKDYQACSVAEFENSKGRNKATLLYSVQPSCYLLKALPSLCLNEPHICPNMSLKMLFPF